MHSVDGHHDGESRRRWPVERDVRIRRVGALPNPSVPACTAVDVAQTPQRPGNLLSVQNLFSKESVEWGAASNPAVIERSAFVGILRFM